MATANIRAVITADDRSGAVLRGFGNKVDSVSQKIGNTVKKVGLAFGAATAASATFAIRSASDFQQSRIAFDTMLGSADKARKMLKDISDFARTTPFELPEVVTGAKQLLAYGIEAKKIIPTFKSLGNIAAGVGRDKLPQLVLAFGQVRTAGKLTGMELRQFTEAGVPLLDALAKQSGKTAAQIKEDMEDGIAPTFQEVEKAIFGMSKEGGKFFNLMDRQSKTFGGIVSNLKDNIGRLARSVLGIDEFGDIRKDSIFAKLQTGAEGLLRWVDRNEKGIQDFFKNIIGEAEGIFRRLQPRIEGVIEALSKFWKEVIVPLIPIIKEGLVVALEATFFILEKVFNFVSEHKEIFIGLALAIGTVKAALVLTSVVNRFVAGIGIMKTALVGLKTSAGTNIATIKGSFSSFAAFLKSSAMIAPWAIFAAAAVTAYIKIKQVINDTIKAQEDANASFAQVEASHTSFRASLDRAVKEGRFTKAQAKQRLGSYYDGLRGKASGGAVSAGTPYMVGERRPEMFVPREGGRIVPQPKMGGSNQTINLNVNVGVYAGTEMEKRKLAESLMRAYQDLQQSRGMA